MGDWGKEMMLKLGDEMFFLSVLRQSCSVACDNPDTVKQGPKL